MFKIWARTTIKDKITVSRVFEFDGRFVNSQFYRYLTEICEKCDIPVPIVLKKHEQHFIKFNNTRFRHSDFVEQVEFTYLILENMPGDKPKTP